MDLDMWRGPSNPQSVVVLRPAGNLETLEKRVESRSWRNLQEGKRELECRWRSVGNKMIKSYLKIEQRHDVRANVAMLGLMLKRSRE